MYINFICIHVYIYISKAILPSDSFRLEYYGSAEARQICFWAALIQRQSSESSAMPNDCSCKLTSLSIISSLLLICSFAVHSELQ